MIKKLVEEHKFFRRLVLVWSVVMITYCTIKVFDKLTVLTGSDIMAYTAVIGLLATCIGFYQWSRGGEGK